jgi:hypothetical protein
MKARVIALCLLVLFLVFSGCATIPTEADLKASLGERAVAYWKLRMEDRYEETYEMESREGRLPLGAYLNKVKGFKKMTILSHSIKGTKIDGLKATVEVEIGFLLPIPAKSKPFTQVIEDDWAYEEGRWRHRLPRK